jgi:hypothetical protein
LARVARPLSRQRSSERREQRRRPDSAARALPGEIQLACSKFFDGEAKVAEDLVRNYIGVHGEHPEALRLLARMASDAGAEFDSELLLQKASPWLPRTKPRARNWHSCC